MEVGIRKACILVHRRQVLTSAEMLKQTLTGCRVAEQLAACLATPFTGDDKNMGEILEGHVRRAIAEAQASTQLRCGACLDVETSTASVY